MSQIGANRFRTVTLERQSQVDWIIVALGWFLFALWLLGAGPSICWIISKSLATVPFSREEKGHCSLVSVIVPARDEGETIEASLLSLLESDYGSLEIIAIDDRSTDETGHTMDRLAEKHDRLQVVHITDLPANWLGKNHAMHVGSHAATGDYLLFTDGDILFEPTAISSAMIHVQRASLDHLCLIPKMDTGGYWESALTTFFGLIFVLGTQPWLIRTAFRRAYAGVGAFNLVRRDAYDECGGHVPIRLDILDDVKLGKMIKRGGFQSELLPASHLLSVRWQASFWGVIRGLEKNAFASQNFSCWNLVKSTLIFGLAFVLPYAGLAFLPSYAALGYFATVLLMHGLYAFLSRKFGGSPFVTFVLPIVAAAMLFSFWRSALVTLKQGGVRWRDTFYPIEDLRANLFE